MDKTRDEPDVIFWMTTFEFKFFSVNQQIIARRSFLGEATRMGIFTLQFFTGFLLFFGGCGCGRHIGDYIYRRSLAAGPRRRPRMWPSRRLPHQLMSSVLPLFVRWCGGRWRGSENHHSGLLLPLPVSVGGLWSLHTSRRGCSVLQVSEWVGNSSELITS